MSYKITMRDKTEIVVPDEAGRALQEHLLSLKTPKNIEILGDMYLSSQIISVTKSNLGGEPIRADRTLSQGPVYSCGPYSIQREIHKRALQNRNWPKLVRDSKWREQTRKKIRAEDPKRKWCDHHANEHACLEVAK